MKLTFSFDDNHALNSKAATLFDKYNAKATFFINIEPTPNHPEPMEDSEIVALSRNGFEIGSHSLSHADLTTLYLNEAKYELEESKHQLETLIKKSVYGFCYPKGKFNSEVKSLVKQVGYKYARTIGEGSYTFSPERPYAIVPTIQVYNKLMRRYIRIRSKNYRTATGDFEKSAIVFIKNLVRFENAVCHIWGHAWEIEEQKLWKDLEKVLEYCESVGIVPVTCYEAYCKC